VEQPKLGWWVNLVDSSSFDEPLVRDVVIEKWGASLVGSCICDVDWPEHNPTPSSVAMYGTLDDAPPDFEMIAEYTRPHMEENQYFVFVSMHHNVLAKGGVKFTVITKHTILTISGMVVIESAVNEALSYDKWLVRQAERNA
jgi:hypothetical protein